MHLQAVQEIDLQGMGAWGHGYSPKQVQAKQGKHFQFHNHAAAARVDVLSNDRFVWADGGWNNRVKVSPSCASMPCIKAMLDELDWYHLLYICSTVSIAACQQCHLSQLMKEHVVCQQSQRVATLSLDARFLR